MYAVLFPGQGSHFVGMGADLFAARPDLLGSPAERILGFSLEEVCLRGTDEQLTRTEFAQPALFAIAYAMWAEVEQHLPTPRAAAGHSLGEYTALVAAGALDYQTALGVVAERGRAMAAAADAEESCMAALLGVDADLAESIAHQRRAHGGRLFVANVNAPGQIVVAGGAADLEWLEENGRGLGARRVVRLNVAGAFHSPFMQPAEGRVSAAVAGMTVAPGRFPVYSNVTARPADPASVPDLLSRQVVAPVRFSESLQAMAAAGVRTFVHVGPGDVTAGMARRTVPDADVFVVNDLAGVGPVRDALSSISKGA